MIHNDKKLEGWRVCRIDPVFHFDARQRVYGHWWLEVSADESYGFWPVRPVSGLWETFLGLPGAVNAPAFCGRRRRDRHHGEESDNMSVFDVWVPVETDERDLLEQVRRFADGFKANWAWPATWLTGENCHTFQEKLLSRFRLRVVRR